MVEKTLTLAGVVMSQLVNISEALEELGLDQSDYDEFLVDLKSFLDESLPELDNAIQSGNFTEIRAKAHAIKGALANLRFVAAAKVAQVIELQGKDNVPDGLAGYFAELQKVLDASFAEISG